MAKKFSNDDPITYTLHEDFDKIFDEKGNSFLALRKVSWGKAENWKYELRKWFVNSNGEEIAGKGFPFLTENGPNELTEMLVREGFGDTETLMAALIARNGTDNSEYTNAIVDTVVHFKPTEVMNF